MLAGGQASDPGEAAMPMRLMIACCVLLLIATPAAATSGEWTARP